ncbi:hypothetical protein GINT2_001381 [Glugoides intestinalis]
MLIKRVYIENFKSFLKKQEIKVGKKNIIIGKNGSGKSNFLAALSAIFLFSDEKRPQYNNNDETSVIEVEIDNSDRRLLLPTSFILKVIFKNTTEFQINEKPISKEELRGLFENAGFTQECFVMQGKVNDIALMNSKQRYELISKVAGVERYEDSKTMAIKLLNEESEEKIEALIEKIEMKMKISEEYKKKAEEYDSLSKAKAEAEFELLNYEIKELNEEIDNIVVGEQFKTVEQNEGLLEYEIKAIKDEVDMLKIQIGDSEDFIRRFEQSIVEQLNERIRENAQDINPYDHKVSVLTEARKEAFVRLTAAEAAKKEKHIELKALKYLDAMGSEREEISVLEEQLRRKREEISGFKDGLDRKEVYKELVGERKQLWVLEKQQKDELKQQKEVEKRIENKILYLGKSSINIYDMIKEHSGVIGTVFSLFDVPDNLLNAFEAVTRSSLFWIVVEDDEVATKLVNTVEGRVTFVPLNRISVDVGKKIHSDSLYRLADQIKCEERHRRLLEMICKGYYISKDNKNALDLCEKYNVNIVTIDGDIFNKNGTITGGYENSNQVLMELKKCKKSISDLESKLKGTAEALKSTIEKIKYSELANNDDSDVLENLQAIERYLVLKISLLKNKKISVPEIADLEIECARIEKSIPKLKFELESLESQLVRASEKKSKIDEIIQTIRTLKTNMAQLEVLKQKEKAMIDTLYVKKANENLDEASRLQKKHLLIDRRTSILRQIGATDFRAIFIRNPKEQVINSLKEINKRLKGFYGFSKRELFDDQRVELRQRLEELRISKTKLLDFIEMLDQKKEDTFNITFSMISDNFSYFFKAFTGKTSTLLLKNRMIDILQDGKPVEIATMSGGQKTMIALSFIFAIQKNDPSPFYVFDEIDANLDQQYCERLADIIEMSDSQYFISSFKTEMIKACDRCFGVVSKDKQSFIDEINKELAYETIKP